MSAWRAYTLGRRILRLLGADPVELLEEFLEEAEQNAAQLRELEDFLRRSTKGAGQASHKTAHQVGPRRS